MAVLFLIRAVQSSKIGQYTRFPEYSLVSFGSTWQIIRQDRQCNVRIT
jgi:hypothetical protein